MEVYLHQIIAILIYKYQYVLQTANNIILILQ